MVLTTLNPDSHLSGSNHTSVSDPDHEDDDDDCWEMVDGVSMDDSHSYPLLQYHTPICYEKSDLQLEIDINENIHEQIKNSSDDDENRDGDVTIANGSIISSITGECHATISDMDCDDAAVRDFDGSLLETTFDASDKSVEGRVEYDEDTLVIVEQLSNMGFSKERIHKAIRKIICDPRTDGVTEPKIDAETIVGVMLGEEYVTSTTTEYCKTNDDGDDYQPTHPLQLPLECTLDFLNSKMRKLKDQHQELRCRAKSCVVNLSQSARDTWSNVVDERAIPLFVRPRSTNNEYVDYHRSANIPMPSERANSSRTSLLESMRRINDEHHLAEKFAAIAVVGSATLLALGHPRASLGAVAVAGASLAVGEGIVVRQQQQEQQQYRTQTEEEELHFHEREDLHLD